MAGLIEIIDSMIEKTWEGPPDYQHYMDKYDVSKVTVEGWAKEASRHLRIVAQSGDELRERLMARVNAAGQRLWQEQDLDAHGYLKALEFEAKVNGLMDKRQPEQPTIETGLEEVARLVAKMGYKLVRQENDGRTEETDSREDDE